MCGNHYDLNLDADKRLCHTSMITQQFFVMIRSQESIVAKLKSTVDHEIVDDIMLVWHRL